MARYREVFEKDNGYRFYRRDKSVVLRSWSYGRRLSPDQNTALVRHTDKFLDTVSRLKPINYKPSAILTLKDFPDVIDQNFYKYVSEETWNYNKEGSFRLGTAAYYRSTPNMNIKDVREGAGFFHLTNGPDQLNASILSGFNAAIYCGTGAVGEEATMRSRFGDRLLKIHPIRKFVERIADDIGAMGFHIYDVVYTDQKNFIAEQEEIQDFLKIVTRHHLTSDLSLENLHDINKRFFHLFHQVGRMPSIFSKPKSYALEQERRVVFEFPADLQDETIMVTDPSLLDFIETL